MTFCEKHIETKDENCEDCRKEWAEQTLQPVTASDLGNQHGYRCPHCRSGEDLSIDAVVTVVARLMVDGTDNDGGDTEWDDESGAYCGACNWAGTVKDLITVEILPEEETGQENESPWTNHYFHCNTLWDDEWSCQCDDECPVCHAEIEPYASTENATGDLHIHAQDVYALALAHDADAVPRPARSLGATNRARESNPANHGNGGDGGNEGGQT